MSHMEQGEDIPLKQPFSSIQSRKVWASACLNTCRLCPSMDLIVLGLQQPSSVASFAAKAKEEEKEKEKEQVSQQETTSTSSNVVGANALLIHRTVSWQKLTTLTFEKDKSISHVTWSPDGRHLALAVPENNEVYIYHVESLSSGGGAGTRSYGANNSNGSTNSSPAAILKITGGPSNAGSADDNGNDRANDAKSSSSSEIPSKILGLSWAHAGRPHPTAWKLSEDQVEAQVSWRYRSRYVDRSSVFLPPSEYHQGTNHNAGGMETMTMQNLLPTCKTPISLLCVPTEKYIDLYLHGRYHLLSLPRPKSTTTTTHRNDVKIVCSNDLTHLIAQESGTSNISLYSLPALGVQSKENYNNRYHLQTIASLHSSINSHIDNMQQAIQEISDSWKSSLKPVDAKLQPLKRLLSNYGVSVEDNDDTIALVLRQYILVGHTGASSNIANAMDQFFTSVQMNDQLLQRTERSLQGAFANLETSVRKGLVSPARALVYHVGELGGLIRYQQRELSPTMTTATRNNSSHTMNEMQALQHSSELVLVSVEALLTQVVDSRSRLRDFVAWLRSTGSQIKARGTAAHSVQRENAKKRRVSQAVVQRMLSYLKTPDNTSACDDHSQNQSICGGDSTGNMKKHASNSSSLTETLLRMTISNMLRETPLVGSTASNNSSSKHNERATSSPRSVTDSNTVGSRWLGCTLPVTTATKQVKEAAEVVFSQPRSILSRSALPKDIPLPMSKDNVSLAILTRIGRDPNLVKENGSDSAYFQDDESDDNDDDEQPTCFSPNVVVKKGFESVPSSLHCRQWLVVAQVHASSNGRSDEGECLQFFAFPLGWKDCTTADSDEEDEESDDDLGSHTRPESFISRGGHIPFYLTATLSLPTGSKIQEVDFYCDDGKSSLSSGTDCGTGKEGRQKFGCLVCSPSDPNATDTSPEDVDGRRTSDFNACKTQKLDLWLLEYDNLHWQALPMKGPLLGADDVDERCKSTLKPIQQDFEDDTEMKDEDNVVLAQTRTIVDLDSDSLQSMVSDRAKLLLSGSRGIGGVILTSIGGTSLELLDLEEDEECDDDEVA